MENSWENVVWHLERDENPKSSSRSFGILFSVVFAIVSWYVGNFYWLIPAAIFLLLALVAPKALNYPNLLWFKFGMLLHKITNPLILGIVFYLVVFPIGMIMKLLGKKLLDPHFDENKSSYWIEKSPKGPPAETMKNQF